MRKIHHTANIRAAKTFPIVLFTIVLMSLGACAGGGGSSYTGRLAKPESMVKLLEGDARELKWMTNDLEINAMYILESNQLDLAGSVQLQSRLENFPVVEYLRIRIHPLDGDGVILGSFPLWSSRFRSEHFSINWAFQRSYTVPETTQAMTFSYRGRVQDVGGRGVFSGRDGNGVDWDFWHTP